MTPDMLTLALFVAFCAALVAGSLLAGRALKKQYGVGSGRAYADTVAELHGETERRGVLLTVWAEAQARRIERLERR